MNKLTYGIALLSILFGFIGCANTQPTKDNLAKWEQDCQTQKEITSNNSTIFAAGECIDYHIAQGENKDSVIVVLHGAHTDGGNPMSWMPKWGRYTSTSTDITTYILAMPGYGGSTSNRFGKMIWTNHLVPSAQLDYIKFTAEILKKIKDKHSAKNLYVFGHSSGADLATTISGLSPNLIQKVIAYAGAYDYPYYFKRWKNYSPHFEVAPTHYVNKIQDTKILLLAGGKDQLSLPKFTKHYEQILLDNNVNVTSFVIKNAKHSLRDVVIWDKAIAFINEDK